MTIQAQANRQAALLPDSELAVVEAREAVARVGQLAPAICMDCGRATPGAPICVACSAAAGPGELATRRWYASMDKELSLPPDAGPEEIAHRRKHKCLGFDAAGKRCRHQTPRGGKDAYCRPCARQIKAAAQILPKDIPDGWQPRRYLA